MTGSGLLARTPARSATRSRVHGGVNQDPSGRTPANPTVVVTQAVAGPAARLLAPNRAPAGTRTTSPAAASAASPSTVTRSVPLSTYSTSSRDT